MEAEKGVGMAVEMAGTMWRRPRSSVLCAWPRTRWPWASLRLTTTMTMNILGHRGVAVAVVVVVVVVVVAEVGGAVLIWRARILHPLLRRQRKGQG